MPAKESKIIFEEPFRASNVSEPKLRDIPSRDGCLRESSKEVVQLGVG